MPQSLSQIYLHIVFSTKDRSPFLQDRSLRDRVHAYLAGVGDNLSSPTVKVGGVEDHVHVLCRMSKTLTVANLVQEIKRDSSKWIKELSPDLAGFYWQKGYGAFSVSPSHVEALAAYIERQEEHHHQESFQDEFRRICEKYNIELDERYAWD